MTTTFIRVHDEDGALAGMVQLAKPRARMGQIVLAMGVASPEHLARMDAVAFAARRPTAILSADLAASSLLSKRLSTAEYFVFGRRLVTAADECVIEHGGVVGRHTGDGVTAFFLAETAGSPSTAARQSIETARALHPLLAEVAQRSSLSTDDVAFRIGVHWGSRLYVGRIMTSGRSEVTGLGDEVNETARIEACTTPGATLASKDLIECLDPHDASALSVDPRTTTYTTLAELPTANEKAKRDMP